MIKSGELDQRRSFSFSSLDFDSSHGLFSSNDVDGCGGDNIPRCSSQGHTSYVMYDTEDDEGAYIEINLNPLHTKTPSVEFGDNNNFHNEKEQLAELRISFSAGFSPTMATYSSVVETCGNTNTTQGTTNNKPRLGLLASLTRIVNAFMASSAKTSNSLRVEASDVAHEDKNGKADCTELLQSRKDRTMVASKHNGVMSLIVKCKYKNIPSMLISMVTPKARGEQMRTRQPLLQRGSSTFSRNPKNDVMKSKNRNRSELDYQDLNRDRSTSFLAGIINLKTIRGVLDALRYYTSGRTGTSSANKHNTKSKSCPSSIKSSPMHSINSCDDEVRRFNTRDNSVQAAIAHCKKSLGAEFEFQD